MCTKSGADGSAERPSLRDRLMVLPQYLLPQHALSRGAGWLLSWRCKLWKKLLILGFSRLYRVDLAEAESSDPAHYPNFSQFFCRRLRAGARPLDPDPLHVLSPVDATISELGRLQAGQMLQAKGRWLSLTDLFGNQEDAAHFHSGSFATLYLSPRDYHRIHIPLDGCLRQMRHQPGRLFSVSPRSARVIPRLYARNERLLMQFDSAAGPMALILVGALLVGGLETIWTGRLPAGAKDSRQFRYAPGEQALDRGRELGCFHMGSTVILLFPAGCVEWLEHHQPNGQLRQGEAFGRILQSAERREPESA